MTRNIFFNAFNGPNKRLNNKNTFLLDISAVLISYLMHKNNDFEKKFRDVCVNSPYAGDEAENFLSNMYCISEYIDCRCHDKSWQDFHKEIALPLYEYCMGLLRLVDEKTFEENCMKNYSNFFEDYKLIKEDLLANNIDLVAAEQSLLYWQEALSDIIMQETMVTLRYSYIKKLTSYNNYG